MEEPYFGDDDDTDQECQNVLRKRILDLCFKEGWTWNKATLDELFWFCWMEVKYHNKKLWNCTQSFLRNLYFQFRSENPNKEWNTGLVSDKRQLWSIEQALRSKNQKPPTWQDIQDVISNGGLASLYRPVNLPKHEIFQYKILLSEHLNSLQNDWLPNVSTTSNSNDAWREEVLNSYLEAFSYILPGKIPNPTLGFVYQLLQDMETSAGFLAKVQAGENRIGQKNYINRDINYSLTSSADDSDSSFSEVMARLDEQDNEEIENSGDLLSIDIVQPTMKGINTYGDSSKSKAEIINQANNDIQMNKSVPKVPSIDITTTSTITMHEATDETNSIEHLEDQKMNLLTEDVDKNNMEPVIGFSKISMVSKKEMSKLNPSVEGLNENGIVSAQNPAASSTSMTVSSETMINTSVNKMHKIKEVKDADELRSADLIGSIPERSNMSNTVPKATNNQKTDPKLTKKDYSKEYSAVSSSNSPPKGNKIGSRETNIIDLTQDTSNELAMINMGISNHLFDNTTVEANNPKIKISDTGSNNSLNLGAETPFITKPLATESTEKSHCKKATPLVVVDLTEDTVPHKKKRIESRLNEGSGNIQAANSSQINTDDSVLSSTVLTEARIADISLGSGKPTIATSTPVTNLREEAARHPPQRKNTEEDNQIKKFLGARVYAEYPENKEWYWGLITRVCHIDRNSPSFTVWFDDGDTADDLPGKSIITESEYKEKWQHVFKKGPPKMPEHLANFVVNGKERGMFKHDMYAISPSNPEVPDVNEATVSTKGTKISILDEGGDSEKVSRKRGAETMELSSEKEIGSRVYCKWKNGNYFWGEIIGKSVLDGSVDQYTVKFDDGDTFKINDIVDGELDANIFTEIEYKAILGKNPPKRRKLSSFSPLTSCLLFDLRCNACKYCEVEKCGRCSWCRNAEEKKNKKSSCLQNMCSKIPYEKKKQHAPGFPSGWTFATGEESVHSEENLCGLLICSPTGNKYPSLEDALNSLESKRGIGRSQVLFQSHLGGSVLYIDKEHELYNKPYLEEWIDVDGNKKVLHGTIIECERDKIDESHSEFLVAFNEDSRRDVLAMGGHCDLEIQRTQKINISKALGGYMAFNFKAGVRTPTPALNNCAFRWITPDMRIESLVSIENNMLAPQLILTWNGFRLVLSVRRSTIPGAGFGVFVECTSLIPGRKTMVLNESEMLDLGVYAPFRKQDLKLQSVFLLKNYVHGLKCEEWSFDVGGKDDSLQYDITDDYTGDIHEIAAKHIPAYVNECKIENTPTVHARHDPQSAVHYLLGVQNKKLVLPTDGTPSEIFINYGPDYERVRVRKNYSFLPFSEQQSHKKNLSSEGAEYFLELCSFGDRDVSSCIRFFRKKFVRGTSETSVIERSLAVVLLLRHRARILHNEMDSSNPFAIEFESDMKSCEDLIRRLLHLHQNKKLKELYEAKDFNSLVRESITPLLHELNPSKIESVVTEILDHR